MAKNNTPSSSNFELRPRPNTRSTRRPSKCIAVDPFGAVRINKTTVLKINGQGLDLQKPVELAQAPVAPSENEANTTKKAIRSKKSRDNEDSLNDTAMAQNQTQKSPNRVRKIILHPSRTPTPPSAKLPGEGSPDANKRPIKIKVIKSPPMKAKELKPAVPGDVQAKASSNAAGSRRITWATKTIKSPEQPPLDSPVTRSKAKSPTGVNGHHGLMEMPIDPDVTVTPKSRENWKKAHHGARRPDGTVDGDRVIQNVMTQKGGINAKWPLLEEYERAVAQMSKGTLDLDKIKANREEKEAKAAAYRKKKELNKGRGLIAKEKAAREAAEAAAAQTPPRRPTILLKRKRPTESDEDSGASSQETENVDGGEPRKKIKLTLTHKNRDINSE